MKKATNYFVHLLSLWAQRSWQPNNAASSLEMTVKEQKNTKAQKQNDFTYDPQYLDSLIKNLMQLTFSTGLNNVTQLYINMKHFPIFKRDKKPTTTKKVLPFYHQVQGVHAVPSLLFHPESICKCHL